MQFIKYIQRILMVALLFLCVQSFGQDVTVTGKVTDAEDGSGLPGVNIQVKGTTSGTVTDFDGNYSISVSSNAVLVFSFVGYAAQEIVVGNQSIIDVALGLDVTQLSEIVVVGYGEQESKDVTGVVATVGVEDFNGGVIVSPDNLIAGKVAGVQVTSNSGEPGSQVSIRIRGASSTQNNEPLYVIDGVPIDNTPINPGGLSTGRNGLNFINPNDIESMTILKDASAAAIYGSRAANGVVIITTKRGAAGETSISYDGWISVGNGTETLDVLTGPEFRELVAQQNPTGAELLANANTDWQAQVLQEAIGQNHSISFSGGNAGTTYRASIGYLKQEGIIKTSETEKLSYSINIQQKFLDDDLSINFNVKGARTDDTYSPGVIGAAASFAPSQPIFDANGFGGYFEWQQDIAGDNPVSTLDQTDETGRIDRTLANVELNYKIPVIEGLSVKANLGFDVSNGIRERFLPPTLRSQNSVATPETSTLGEIRVNNFTRESALLETYATYERDIEAIESSFDITGGYSYQNFEGQFPEYRIAGIEETTFGTALPGIGDPEFVELGNNQPENRLISFFGRLNYSFKDRYIATFNFRRDGSSRFGPNNRWGNFPSAAVGWRISEEPFFSNLTSIFDNLKLRVGWGIIGNQEPLGNFDYLPTVTLSRNDANAFLGGEPVTTLRFNSFNPNLQWEETESLNIGLEFAFLKGRLSGSLEYYSKETSDLLFRGLAAPALAFPQDNATFNFGTIENKGLELELSGIVIDKGFLNWTVNFNVAYNDNEVTELFGADDPAFNGFPRGGISGGVGQNIQRLLVGEEAFTFFVRKHRRNDDGSPVSDTDENGQARSLVEIYEDLNGDDEITDDDLVPMESPFADLTYGLTSSLTYKNFDLNFTLRASTGNYVYNNIESTNANFAAINAATPSNILRSALDNNFTNAQILSDIYIEDASFLRMDNITVGYNVPGLPDGLRVRAYSTIQNLFVITGYDGLDPEIGNISNDPGNPQFGIDNNVFPRARTFIFGVNIGF
ncbi:MAG: TonB-dependent receptor [Bacteroidota bacterium]